MWCLGIHPLTMSEKRFRWVAVSGGLLIFVAVAIINPALGKMYKIDLCPFFQLSGLPCLFCGGTRATQALLRGQWEQAFYYNWLAFPAVLGVVVLMLLWSIELYRGHRLFRWEGHWLWRSPTLWLFGVMGMVSWSWHIYQAITIPKQELLNQQAIFAPLWKGYLHE